MTEPIVVSDRVYQRFEARREETKQRDCPAMDQSAFLDSLLDTQQAAREGYYDES